MLLSGSVGSAVNKFVVIVVVVYCCSSIRLRPQTCINKRLQCPSLASTLRYPIIPKVVSKRKYVGLDEPNFDEDAEEKRPDAGKEYDPDGDYIYDARKYFDPEKYREIIANEEEEKKKQEEMQKRVYYRPFRSHRRYNSKYLPENFADVKRERSSSLTSSLLYSESCAYDVHKLPNDNNRSSSHHKKSKTISPLYLESPACDVDELLNDNSRSSSHHKKSKKKLKHSKHHSHTSKASRNSIKQEKSEEKKHKKKRKRKKSDDKHGKSLNHNHSEKHSKKSRHRLRPRHKSKLFSSQAEPVEGVPNCDYSDSYHYVDQSSMGNDHDSSDAHYLSDNSINGLNYHRHPSADKSIVSGGNNSESGFLNSAEKRFIACDAADADDPSVASDHSDDMNRKLSYIDDVNKKFCYIDEASDYDEDIN